MTHSLEAKTPAFVAMAAQCPMCGNTQYIGVTLSAELVTGDDGSELKVKAKSKGVDHTCGQLAIHDVTPGPQVGMDEALDQMVDQINAGAMDDPETGTKVTARRGRTAAE